MTFARKHTPRTRMPAAYSQQEASAAMRDSVSYLDARIDDVNRRLDLVQSLAGVASPTLPPPTPTGGAGTPVLGPPPAAPIVASGGGVSTLTVGSSTATMGVRSRQTSVSVRAANALRSRDDFVQLNIAPDPSRDTWAVSTVGGVEYRGPRRIWKVRSHAVHGALPENPTSMRFRVVAEGRTFGVLACRFLDELANLTLDDVSQTGSRWEVTYGIVVTGIPNLLGRFPSRATVDYAEHSAAAQIARNVLLTKNWLTNTRTMFEARAGTAFNGLGGKTTTIHSTGAPASGWMVPDTVTSAYPDSLEGFRVTLITGETGDQVYAQVNGLGSPNLSYISGRPRGLAAVLPYGGIYESACPPNVTVIDSSTQLTARTDATLVDTDEVVEGCPIVYGDCEALMPKRDSFSVIVTVDPPRVLEWSDISGGGGLFAAPTDDLRPAMWHTTGFKMAAAGSRKVAFDLILE